MYATRRPLVIAITIVHCVSGVGAMAADTGTISGAVFDKGGQPIAEATVKISGETLPTGRTVAERRQRALPVSIPDTRRIRRRD